MTPPHPNPLVPSASATADVEAVFKALLDFMGQDYVNGNVYAVIAPDGSNVNCSINVTDKANNQWQYSERITGPRCQISPNSATLGPSQAQQFIGTVVNPDGSSVANPAITWSCTGPGTVGATGLYTAPATIAANGTDTVTALDTASQSSASASVNLHP